MPRRDDIRRLHEQRAHLISEMRSLSERAEKSNRDLSAEETEQMEKFTKDFEEYGARAKRAEDLYKKEQEIVGDLTQPIEHRIGIDDNVPETFKEYREQRSGTPVSDQAEFRNAFWRYISVNSISDLDVEEHRALSKGTTTAGGFLVPTNFYNQIVRSLRFMGAMANLATEITTDSGETIQIPANTAHGTAAWLAEAGTYTPSDETFAQINLNAFKASTKVIVSEELLEDSAFNLDGFLAQEIGERIGVLENTAYVQGDGSGKPQGILASATASNITTITAATGNATAFTYDALVTAKFSLPYQYRRNATWIVNDSSVRNLYLMKDSQQRPLWHVNIQADGPDTFLGDPIYTDPDMPTPAANNISMAYGDWKRAYYIRRVTGFGLQRQNELHSDTGQVGFRAYERVDGRVVLAAAAVAVKHSAT
jgi:HK97 family phage major capsid protein